MTEGQILSTVTVGLGAPGYTKGSCSILDVEKNMPSKKEKEKGTAKPERMIPILKTYAKKRAGEWTRNLPVPIFPEEKNRVIQSFIYLSRTIKLKSNGKSNEIATEVAFTLVIETALDISFHRNLSLYFTSLNIKIFTFIINYG